MKKLIGVFAFLLVLYAGLLLSRTEARSAQNHFNLAGRIGLEGILCLAVTPLIISGGIDLSIGAVIGFCATLLAILLADYQWNPLLAITTVLATGAVIGLINGLLISLLRLQPFVVTLCGLFIYRGLARWIADDHIIGAEKPFLNYIELLYDGSFLGMPKFFVIFLALAGVLAILLHLSVYGRYWKAIGANEKTAQYSGIRVNRYKILAYVLCSTLAALYSILYLTKHKSVTPTDVGNFRELYAIAGAVLGGVSLRGGEGNVLGVIMGAIILVILPNFVIMWGFKDNLEYTVIGSALLIGAIVDELLRRRVGKS